MNCEEERVSHIAYRVCHNTRGSSQIQSLFSGKLGERGLLFLFRAAKNCIAGALRLQKLAAML